MPLHKCRICQNRILSHACWIKCDKCQQKCHISCIHNVNKQDPLYVNRSDNIWFCQVCMSDSLPFLSILDDIQYKEAILELQHTYHFSIS